MEKEEAAFYFGDFRDLVEEFKLAELSEIVDDRSTHREILTCNVEPDQLQ